MIALVGGSTVTPGGTLEDSVILIEDGKIAGCAARRDLQPPAGAVVMEIAGAAVVPGFIDTHVHGCHGVEVMDAAAASVLKMARELPRYGVTAFLATTIAATDEQLRRVIGACLEAIDRQESLPPEQRGALIAGLHLEGPYINPLRKGAQPLEGIRPPDLPECARYLHEAAGTVRLMTLAPELPGGLELIRMLKDQNIVSSLGHTDADFATACRAIDAGAGRATHLFNQMPPMHHRSPGLAAACLNDSRVVTEIITDGVHVHPEMILLALRAKTPERVCLITDAIAALGMPDGTFHLGPHPVTVKDGRCTLSDGTLAGSIHRMDAAVANSMRFTGCSLEDAVHMASVIPARAAGLQHRKGSLTVGRDADIVVLRDGAVELTLTEGVVA